MQFTLLLSVDGRYIDQLKYSYYTWVKFKKELRDCPIVLIYDKTQVHPSDEKLAFLKDRKVKYVAWDEPSPGFYGSQREKMLTAFTVVPALHVETPWYLKLDTDAVAFNDDPWFLNSWFEPMEWTPATSDAVQEVPAYIANPWGYTKPANALDIMDKWASQIPELASYPNLDIPFDPTQNKVCHPRMCSWIMFGSTQFCKFAARFADQGNGTYKLPFPSQDTYLGYIADRTKFPRRLHKFKKSGWNNFSNFHNLKSICLDLVAGKKVEGLNG